MPRCSKCHTFRKASYYPIHRNVCVAPMTEQQSTGGLKMNIPEKARRKRRRGDMK